VIYLDILLKTAGLYKKGLLSFYTIIPIRQTQFLFLFFIFSILAFRYLLNYKIIFSTRIEYIILYFLVFLLNTMFSFM